MTDQKLTHIDEKGEVRMVDVSQKADTERVAVAEGFIAMHPETLGMIAGGTAKKGDVLASRARGGRYGGEAHERSYPLCATPSTSPRPRWSASRCSQASASTVAWASTCCAHAASRGRRASRWRPSRRRSVACLTVYDMCKAVDRGMEIMDVRLLKKDGGKTGLWLREEHEA